MTCKKCGGLLKRHINGKDFVCIDCFLIQELPINKIS